MPSQIQLTYTGSLAPEQKVTARTLSHTLDHFQRAIDKAVLFQHRGVITKYASLPRSLYDQADLYVAEFQEGSVVVPLLGQLYDGTIRFIDKALSGPFQRAATDENERDKLHKELTNAYNQIESGAIGERTQRDLIETSSERREEYALTRVGNDLSNVLSPLSGSGPSSYISFNLHDEGISSNYTFDKGRAASFTKVVRSRSLGPAAIFRGWLDGLDRHGSRIFPYVGHFRSEDAKNSVKLFVPDDESAQKLNDYNISERLLSIWAAPIAKFKEFDPIRGDIVFIRFA